MTELNVLIPASKGSYNITISSDIAKKSIENHSKNNGFFVVDKNVSALYADLMPKNSVYIYNAFEDNKTLNSVENILKWLLEEKALRDSAIMAIGGGITGDVVGFVSSIFMRGIKVIQMPTTLLSMVDSAVGGKTGVNFCGIKNNIGAFHQPSSVVMDLNFLKTLSDDEFLNGFAEVIKIAAIEDKEFFNYLKDNKNAILDRDVSVMEKVVYTSCKLKAAIVEDDEKEKGRRKLLNFGHTIAHAIETDSNHNIHHGYAVAMGMMYETEFALKNNYADEEVYNSIKEILLDFGYNITYKPKNIDVFYNAIAKDKKATQKGISLALTERGLKGRIVEGVSAEDLVGLFG